MRIFSLRNNQYEIEPAILSVFRWGALDTEISHQLGFEEQYLQFHRYLLNNLQSIPTEHPEYSPRLIGLSLRAGAIKSYIVFACSIIEGVLASWANNLNIYDRPERIFKLPLGALLKCWEEHGTPREEVAPIWSDLQLLLEYRNFIHLGRAATSDEAYWRNIIEREQELLQAVDNTLDYLSEQCSGQ